MNPPFHYNLLARFKRQSSSQTNQCCQKAQDVARSPPLNEKTDSILTNLSRQSCLFPTHFLAIKTLTAPLGAVYFCNLDGVSKIPRKDSKYRLSVLKFRTSAMILLKHSLYWLCYIRSFN